MLGLTRTHTWLWGVLLFVVAAGPAGCARVAPDTAGGCDPDTIPDAYARPGAALAWPGATRALELCADGSAWNGAWRVALRPAADGVSAPPPRTIAFESRWCPVAHWRRTSGAVRWDFEAAALPAGGAADTQLVVSLLVRARNGGSAPAHASLALDRATPDTNAAWVADDARASAPLPRWDDGEGAAGWHAGAPGDTLAFTLAPGASRDERVLLGTYPLARATLARWRRRSHADCAAETRRYWRTEVERGTTFALHETEVEDAIRAARVVLLECRERIAGHVQPIGNPLQYRDVWLRDGARATAALAVSGYTAESRALADGLAQFAWQQGAYVSQRGQLDGTGEALWAFAQALLRPAPDTTLARFADGAFAGCRWFEMQRVLGARAGWPLARFVPFGDPRDGELARAQLTGNDAWSIAGCEAAARLLRAAGREREAAHADSLRACIAFDFAVALAASGSPDVPPSWQGVGRDWGNLSAGWPCHALPAHDPRLLALARRAWAGSAVPGLVSYGGRDSLHLYLGADLGSWALLAGRPALADTVLAALLHWRDATGAAGELVAADTRETGRNLPPHATAAAALVALVRNMVVFDDGELLQLTLGPRAAWWRGATVKRAPTRFGLVDLAFDAGGEAAHWHWSAVPVWTELSLPAGRVLAAAPAEPLRGVAGGRSVLAPPGTTDVRAALAPAGGAR